MMFTACAKVCAIIGNPVAHSLSPLLHGILARESGKDFAYVPFCVGEADLEKALKGAYALGIEGINITLPYKKAVLPYLEKTDTEAAAIGSVNTLCRGKNAYIGFNTDMPGLADAISRNGKTLCRSDIILLGAGGAAPALLYLCAKSGVSSISLINRSRERAERLVEEYRSFFPFAIEIRTPREIEEAKSRSAMDALLRKDEYLVFQASSLGMYPDILSCLIHNPLFYEKAQWGMDFIYTPSETRFMRYLREAKKEACSGLDMLIGQGILSFEIWNPGIKIGEETRKRAKEELSAALKEQEAFWRER